MVKKVPNPINTLIKTDNDYNDKVILLRLLSTWTLLSFVDNFEIVFCCQLSVLVVNFSYVFRIPSVKDEFEEKKIFFFSYKKVCKIKNFSCFMCKICFVSGLNCTRVISLSTPATTTIKKKNKITLSIFKFNWNCVAISKKREREKKINRTFQPDFCFHFDKTAHNLFIKKSK